MSVARSDGVTAQPPATRLRLPLALLVAPLVVALVAGSIGDWFWPVLLQNHPLFLVGLSGKNRFLLLTAPNVGAAGFFVVGFFRLVFTDPAAFAMGRQYGEEGLAWADRKMGADPDKRPSLLRKAEAMFNRAAPLVIVVAPSMLFCILAGAGGMRPWKFITCNVAGTIGRLALFWYAAVAFREPLEALLDTLGTIQTPLLALTTTLAFVQTLRVRRRKPAHAGEVELTS